ncbi:MAG: glycosyltransferase [Rhizobiaceae bacterium]|nr:glycosyltransferase [Rhizobiaceae bacterium]
MELNRLEHTRILMYSHDTFGLGHLRRCRAIAHAIVEQFKGVSVLIISGSQIAGAFNFRARVDFVKIPSVIKLYNGEYDSIGEYIDIDEILEMRKLIIQRTAEVFQPDIFIADKEPMGLKGELIPTLVTFKDTKTKTVLGLRDVMDSPELLKKEWAKSDMVNKIGALYDRVWVYGPETFWNPLRGFELPETMTGKMAYTGFLDREAFNMPDDEGPQLPENYILATAGGGGDGVVLMEQILAAREHDRANDFPIVMVLGPFMKSDSRDRIRLRAASLPNITVLDFESHMEVLIRNASAIVGMCGYNTFCEAMSFDKRTLFVPRTTPREEQLIRATRAQELGLCEMLLPEEAAVPSLLAEKLAALPSINVPSKRLNPNDMAGLGTICSEVAMLSQSSKPVDANSEITLMAGQ